MSEEAKTQAEVKTKHQVTVVFDLTDAREKAAWTWVEKTCKAYAIRPTQLLKSAISHGAKEAGARAKSRYEALKGINDGLFDLTAPEPEADSGRWLDSTRGPGTCRTCKADIPAKSRAGWYADKTMECETCYGKVAA